MSDRCPTLLIETENGPVVINASDYDSKKHKLFLSNKTTITEPILLEEMSATQLREYAKENNIDVTGLKSRADLFAAVKPAEPAEPAGE